MEGSSQAYHSIPENDEIFVKRPNGFKLPVELLMFVFYFAKTLTDTVVVNIIERNTCVVILHYVTNCTVNAEEQQITVNLLMVRSVTEALIPALLIFFIGPWSDTNGRRPLILLSLTGYTAATVMWTVLSVIPWLHPMYFLLTSIPVALSGGYVCFFLALYCYISDVTNHDKRAFRMTLVMTGCLMGVLVSSLATPYLLETSAEYGYTIVFSTSCLLLLLTLIVTYFFVAESVPIVESERTRLWKLDHVNDMFVTCFRRREHHVRSIVLMIVINSSIYLILFEGEMSVVYLFLQKQYAWSLKSFTELTAFVLIVAGVSLVVSTWFFSTLLKVEDMTLMFIGTLFLLGKALTEAFNTSAIYFYLANVFSIVTVLISPLSRSQLSKLVPPDELGKIFAFTSFLEAMSPLAASPLYSLVYKATMDTFPNAVFWLSFGVSIVSVLLIGSALLLHRMFLRDDQSPLLND